MGAGLLESVDGLFFRGVDYVSPLYRTPGAAILIQGLVSVVLLLVLGSFPRALDFTIFAIVIATSADVLALYRLRRSQPDRPRPYRAWGYPYIPAVYLVVSLGIAVALLRERPLECCISLGMLAVGLPFYRFFRRNDRDGIRAGSRFLE